MTLTRKSSQLHYDVLRNALTQNGMSAEEALQALNDSWNQNHNAWVQVWDAQVAADVALAAAQAQQPQPDDPLWFFQTFSRETRGRRGEEEAQNEGLR